MVRQQQIEDRIERFVHALLGLVREVSADAVRAAAAKSAKSAKSAKQAPQPPKAKAAAAVKPSPGRGKARVAVPPAAEVAPESGVIAAEPAPSERQEAVMSAVRAL